ncbi:MAG TPA: helix-turn-helix domain-containing protein [Puia sp.]|jgi:excisionase family DNA binding protein|nr:helix-turn-helix domain-containing protein [Puia sp.]
MEALLEKTTKADQQIARASVEKLKKASKSGKSIQISQKPDQQSLRIPEKAMKLLIAILSNMADGKDTAVLSADTYISTQEAADYLRVSRPHLVDLLEGGDIPFVKVGTHRRIKLSDLVAFDKKRKRLMTKGLKFLAKQAQELGLYDID